MSRAMFSFLIKSFCCIYIFYPVIYSTVYCNRDVINSVKINALQKNENADGGNVRKHSGRSYSHEIKGHSRAKEIAVKLGGYIEGRENLMQESKIIISSKSVHLSDVNRTYFYGKKHYEMSKHHEHKCDYEITESDEVFDLWSTNAERITEIVYECLPDEECCHGLDCCANETFKWYYYLVIIGGVIGLSVTCFLIYRFCFDQGDYDTTTKRSSLKIVSPKLTVASKDVFEATDNQSDVKRKRRGSKVVESKATNETSSGVVEIHQSGSTVLSTKLLSPTAAVVGRDQRSLAIKETSKVAVSDELSPVSAVSKSIEKDTHK